MNKLLRNIVILLTLVVLAAVGLQLYLSHSRTHYNASLSLSNIETAELINTEKQSRQNISLEGDPTVSLPYNSSNYEIHYQSTSGHADGVYQIEPNQKQIDIQPSLDEQTLSKRLEAERANIHGAIKSTYKNFDDIYTIASESLYTDGNWYGAKLDYRGGGVFYRDSVGLVMHKQNNQWQLITEPPQPSLHSPSLPDVPIELISGVNESLHSN